jgi:hypothetical protein
MMRRYVFFALGPVGTEELTAAARLAGALGARVTAALSGKLVVDADLEAAARLASALPGWDYTADTPRPAEGPVCVDA